MQTLLPGDFLCSTYPSLHTFLHSEFSAKPLEHSTLPKLKRIRKICTKISITNFVIDSVDPLAERKRFATAAAVRFDVPLKLLDIYLDRAHKSHLDKGNGISIILAKISYFGLLAILLIPAVKVTN